MRNDHGVIYRSIHLGQHCWSVVRDVAAFARVIAVAKLLGSDPTWTADHAVLELGRSTSRGGPSRNLSRFHWGEDGQHQKRILSDLPVGSNWAYRTRGGVPTAKDVTLSLPSSSSRLGQRESGGTPK